MVMWILLWDCASFEGGTLGVDHFIFPALLSVLIVMHMAMDVLVRYVERRIIIFDNMMLGGGTVGIWSLRDVKVFYFGHVGHTERRRRTRPSVETILGRYIPENRVDVRELP